MCVFVNVLCTLVLMSYDYPARNFAHAYVRYYLFRYKYKGIIY